MLKFRHLPYMSDERCHECGRQWFEVSSQNPNDGPDIRRYAEIKGVIGCCQIRTILCPYCIEDNADTLADASGLRHIYAANKEYDRELAIDMMLSRIPFDLEDERQTIEDERVVIKHLNLRTVR